MRRAEDSERKINILPNVLFEKLARRVARRAKKPSGNAREFSCFLDKPLYSEKKDKNGQTLHDRSGSAYLLES